LACNDAASRAADASWLRRVWFESLEMKMRGHRITGTTIVRCRRGHLFTTVWIPGASLKAIRLGSRRVQYCPVGRHWSIVVAVPESELTSEEAWRARDRHDVRLP
jgi:hypothetical protein